MPSNVSKVKSKDAFSRQQLFRNKALQLIWEVRVCSFYQCSIRVNLIRRKCLQWFSLPYRLCRSMEATVGVQCLLTKSTIDADDCRSKAFLVTWDLLRRSFWKQLPGFLPTPSSPCAWVPRADKHLCSRDPQRNT